MCAYLKLIGDTPGELVWNLDDPPDYTFVFVTLDLTLSSTHLNFFKEEWPECFPPIINTSAIMLFRKDGHVPL